MLEYSVYIHAAGVALLLGLSKLLSLFTSVELHYGEAVTGGVSAYFSSYTSEAVIILFLYLVYVIVAAEIMGAFKIPHRIAGFVSRVAGFPSSKIPFYPQPSPANPEQPVWYEAFHRASEGSQEGRPQVLVRMKSGDWYHGELAAYPILPDEVSDKDFLVTKARYARADAPSKVHSLELANGGGTVLLNTSNVDSIQIYYG